MIYATYVSMILAVAGAIQAAPAPAAALAATCDAALTALFTPPKPVLGRYEVCTTSAPFDEVLAAGGAHYAAVEALAPLDAFGAAGPYDRSLVARLYGGVRAKVVHGWSQTGDRFVSTTLISPYPDPTLTRLLPGTMEIRWTSSAPVVHEWARVSSANILQAMMIDFNRNPTARNARPRSDWR